MDNKKAAEENNLGFNDAELADIMNEIEDLERDLNSDISASAPVPPKETKEPVDNSVLEEFVQEPVEKVLPFSTKTAPVVASNSDQQSSSMNFNVSGNMTVALSFTVSGQTINLTMNESTGLVIDMHGGAKFCLPLNANSDVKKKAS